MKQHFILLALYFLLAITAASACKECDPVYDGEMSDSLNLTEQNAIWDENSQTGKELLEKMATCPKEDGSCLPPYNDCNIYRNCSCYTANELLQLRGNNSFCIEGWDCYRVGEGRGEYNWNETESDDNSSGSFTESSYTVFDGKKSYLTQVTRIIYNGTPTFGDREKGLYPQFAMQVGNQTTFYDYAEEEVKLGLPRSGLRNKSEQW